MNALHRLALASLILAPSVSVNAFELNDTLTLNVSPALVSDYRADGISQTLGDPAAQLDLMLSHASGLYAGIWTSTVDYGLDYATRQEIDYYAGYYWQINDDISLDTWLTRYEYPKTSAFNSNDIQSELNTYGVLLGGRYSDNLHDEELNEEESLSSWYLGYQTLLPLDIGVRATYETVDYKDDVFWTTNGSSRADYNNWEIKLNKELWHLDWSLSYIDTDLSDTECESFTGYRDLCSATVVAGVSTTF
ncbi:MAG TPA: TorF family putative porin [Pseudomonas sp.]|nr:TorF family putative porin [Pseudomonas sp.]